MPDNNSATVSELVAGYVAAQRLGELVIPRCRNCKRWNWYPRILCDNCGSSDRELIPVAPAGVVYSWTRVQRALPPVRDLPTPYVVVLVELSEVPGARIPCRLASSDIDPVIGQTVHLDVADADPPYFVARPGGDDGS